MKWLLLLVCVSLVLGMFFISGGNTEIAHLPPKNQTIVAFGDSLVEGVGATEGNDFVSQLGKLIDTPITNKGVRGNTTADGLARLPEVLAEDPGIVLLLLGGNDTLRQVPIETTESNLRKILTAFKEEKIVTVLIGVRGGVLNRDREQVYEALAEEFGAVYVPDILDGIFLKPELMFGGIHPNDAGYARIASRLSDVFEEYGLLE